jgi:hypothetical protein
LTEGPVTVLVADGAVVVVLVDGAVVVPAGLVVLVDGDVVEVSPEAVVEVDEVDEEPVDLEIPTGEEPAPPELTEDPFEVVVLEAMPRVRGADLVWNASTPASPAAVATATMGARFMGLVSLSQSSCDRPVS